MSIYTGRSRTVSHGVHSVFITDMTKFEFHTCGHCGVVWGMPESFLDVRREDGASWYCPNGHKWHWSGETVEQKLMREQKVLEQRLARERDRAARATARADQTQASLSATRGVVTKQRKKLARVANGVCPCCNRSFVNLERHMNTKHPEFKV